jgi:hypothetical protein
MRKTRIISGMLLKVLTGMTDDCALTSLQHESELEFFSPDPRIRTNVICGGCSACPDQDGLRHHRARISQRHPKTATQQIEPTKQPQINPDFCRRSTHEKRSAHKKSIGVFNVDSHKRMASFSFALESADHSHHKMSSG